MSEPIQKPMCACAHRDARECAKIRDRRNVECESSIWPRECECACHSEYDDEDEWDWDS